MGIFNIFSSGTPLKKKVSKIKSDIKLVVAKACSEKASLIEYGTYELNPISLVIWICIDTDEMKNRLKSDTVLNQELQHILVINEYPAEAINYVHIGFESQETVNRESNGDWYIHFK